MVKNASSRSCSTICNKNGSLFTAPVVYKQTKQTAVQVNIDPWVEAHMMKLKLVTILLLVLVTAPLAAFAMSHQDHAADDHGKATETDHHGEMKHGDHGSSQAE
jgi:hypothetical protein